YPAARSAPSSRASSGTSCPASPPCPHRPRSRHQRHKGHKRHYGKEARVLTFQGRQILDTLPEIVHPDHTVVMVHDMQNDNTGKGGKYDTIGRRIDVTSIIPPIAGFLGHARAARCTVLYTQYTNLPDL